VSIKEFIGGCGIAGVGGFFLYASLTSNLPIFMAENIPGPMFFPVILSSLLVILGLMFIAQTIKHRDELKREWSKVKMRDMLFQNHARYPLIFLILSAMYIYAFPLIGCILSTFLYSTILQRIFGRKLRDAIVISLGVVVIIYVLFIRVLRVVFPEPIIGDIIYLYHFLPIHYLSQAGGI